MKSLLPIGRHKSAHGKHRALSSEDDAAEARDRVSLLPAELLFAIFEHLTTPADFLSVLNVCRTWRAILLSPEIWTPFAERLAPGLVNHIHASSPSVEARDEAFHSVLRQYHLRREGHFSLARHHRLHLSLEDDALFSLPKPLPLESGGVHSLADIPNLDLDAEDDHVSRLKLYSHGRVAWWPEAWHLPFFAVVDDLRTHTRRMYLFPEHIRRLHKSPSQGSQDSFRGWKTAMGECLFVMGQEEVGVCVWHLERHEMREIKLPGAFDLCVVQGERLLFVGRRAAEVWTWSWEAASIDTVDATGQGCYASGPVTIGGQIALGYPPNPRTAPRVGLRFRDTDVKLDFILHPTDSEVLFVVTYDDVDLVVSELTSGKLTDRIPLPRGHLAYRILQQSRIADDMVHYLRYERCDAYGGYCLLTAALGMRQFCDGGCPCSGGIGSVCFNVYTKRFTAFVHHGSYERTPETHLWDGLLSVGVSGSRYTPGGASNIAVDSRAEPLVALLRPCDGSRVPDPGTALVFGQSLPVRKKRTPATGQAPMPEVFHFVPSGREAGSQARPKIMYGVAYVLEAGTGSRYESARGLDPLNVEWLTGDDRTLLYAVGKEYTIWKFGEHDDCFPRKEQKAGRSWRKRWRNVMAGVGRGVKS